MELDFAIFAFLFEEKENIVQSIIFKDDLILVKRKDTQNDELLLLQQGHCLREYILDNIDKTKLSPYACASLETLVTMIDALIGSLEGDSPNSAFSGMQLQLFDLIENLKWIDALNQTDILPNRREKNKKLKKIFRLL